ncbi:MAG TPA: hypothetical protein VD902_10885 [Symbiobacteriaceae bacterium]|nr:hypothetical protein [Symbiobacteriaceae bacterium]
MKPTMKARLTGCLVGGVLCCTAASVGIAGYVQYGQLRASAEHEATALAKSISRTIQVAESAMGDHLLAAGQFITARDAAGPLTDADLVAMTKTLKVFGISISDSQGIFTTATDAASRGLDIFKIRPNYRDIAEGKSPGFVASLFVRVQDGKTAKAITLPRSEGRGIVNVVQSVDTFIHVMRDVIANQSAVERLQLATGTTYLVDEVRAGSGGLAGKKPEDETVQQVLTSGEAQVQFSGDRLVVYIPVTSTDFVGKAATTYVLRQEQSLTGMRQILI